MNTVTHFQEMVIEQENNEVTIPYSRALEIAKDIEFDHVDIEGNAQVGLIVRLPFTSLFNTLGGYMIDESSILLLYSLLRENSNFLEHVLV
ncbi:hypothetical protein SUGI_0305750 [Cryptomeria japonica]|nr:hypothetical protein SUGI_0305750 [Cryptomeria japonica]